MATISQIQIGNQIYDICDANNRQTTETINDTIDIIMTNIDDIQDRFSNGVLKIANGGTAQGTPANVTDKDALLQALGIGIFYSNSAKTTITAANIDTLTNGASLTLPKGSYILTGSWEFPAASDSGVRVCQASIKAESSLIEGSRNRVVEGANNYVTVRTAIAHSLTDTTTIYIAGSSSKATGTPSHNNNYIEAIKIA